MKKEDAIKKIKETGKLQLFMKIIENRQYDQLYTLFGKTIYNLFAPLEHKKKDIKKLMEEKNYGLIYQKYGQLETMFIKGFKRLSTEEIKKLIQEKRYVELQNTYGDKKADKIRFKAYQDDIEYETGSKFKAKTLASTKKTIHGLKEAIKGLTIFTTTIGVVIAGNVGEYIKENYKQSLIENEKIINEYDEEISNYATKIQELHLDNDLEIVMKVMDDMWKEIEYGKPTKDITGLGRLAFTEEEKVGVCRNIADDFSARMNAINPEYNARNLTVKIDFNYYSKDSLANIDRTIKETNETVINGEENKEKDDNDEINEFLDKINLENYSGNHMVTIFEPIKSDYTLVVDATNPSIGIIANGKIYMFSTENRKGIEYKPLGQIITVQNYDFNDINQEFTKSFISFKSENELSNIESEWNTEKQNEALKKIKALNKESINNKIL